MIRVFCPVHKEHLLEIEKKMISVAGVNIEMVAGTCPKCDVVYTDRALMGSKNLTYKGARYCCLTALHEASQKERLFTAASLETRKSAQKRKDKSKEQPSAPEKKKGAQNKKTQNNLPTKIYLLKNYASHCPYHMHTIMKTIILRAGKPIAGTTEWESVTVKANKCGICKRVFTKESEAKYKLSYYSSRFDDSFKKLWEESADTDIVTKKSHWTKKQERSEIAVFEIQKGKQIVLVRIVEDPKDADLKRNTIDISARWAKELLEKIVLEQTTEPFDFQNESCKILKYQVWEGGRKLS